MATHFLFPGQEYCRVHKEENGVHKVEYAYCSERGKYFSCIASSKKEAQDQCAYWLLRQERN